MNKLFKNFKHSIPIIYSHIENQYPYKLSSNKKTFLILFTSFDYHFITGEIPNTDDDLITEMRYYIEKNSIKEFILFAQDTKWEKYLDKIFKKINGVVDLRCSFNLDLIKFTKKFNDYSPKHNPSVKYCTDDNSMKPYYKSLIEKNGNIVCYSNAFMIGRNNAEIDVWTDENHRLHGLAFEASLFLISKLLNNNLIPNWTTWDAKESSRNLAKKLGFNLEYKTKAFIWVEDFGKF